jgi:hypothetical protein
MHSCALKLLCDFFHLAMVKEERLCFTDKGDNGFSIIHFILKPGCFGKTLDPRFKQLIAHFQAKYEMLQEVSADIFEGDLTLPWKVHITVAHLPTFLESHQVGMSRYAEQMVEACHADFKKTQKRFKGKPTLKV